MRSNPPPLQLLPAFNAAARFCSFRKAAADLNVTPSAISQQIKTLEEVMGRELFKRSGRSVALTPFGSQYYDLVARLLKDHDEGYKKLQKSYAKPVVRISTTTQIAFDLLIPALPEFNLRHPDIDLRIEINESIINFDDDWADAAVRIGDGLWPGLQAEKLCELTATAVASPTQIASVNPQSPHDMRKFTLIHSRTDSNDWAAVAKLSNIDLAGCRELFFDSNYSAITAGENDLGLLLILLPLARRRLETGSLQKAFAGEVKIAQSCYIVAPNEAMEKPANQQVFSWLRALFSQLEANAPLPTKPNYSVDLSLEQLRQQ